MGNVLSFRRLQEMASSLGVADVGVTSAEPFPELRQILLQHRRDGFESGFEHPDIDRRCDPRQSLPEAKSIISVAVPYRTEDIRSVKRPKGIRGLVSRYAWGQDYHPVVKKILVSLVEMVEEEIGQNINAFYSVDTGPLVDRAVAERAGIGWVGKNCSLITRRFGSYVFLGQAVVDVEIEHGPEPMENDCGDCDRCIRACPTDALREPYRTDSSRCLSYLTQKKGMIPEPYRNALGRRVWGCDTCQVVCPKNNGVSMSSFQQFAPDPALSFPELLHLLAMRNRQFRRAFGHTATAWRGLGVLQRNAIIVLGNMKEQRAVPRLKELLSDPRPFIRGTAAWALREIDPEGTREAVREALEKESDSEAAAEMRWAAAISTADA